MLKPLRNTIQISAWVALCALGQYELVAKSDTLLGSPLPGFWTAARVERDVTYNPQTGIGLVDHVIHESQEAIEYYGKILF